MLSANEVLHIAKLARLGLTPKEVEKFRGELSLILDYIEKLKEVDISGIEPTSHSVTVENVTREDEINREQRAKNKELLDLAPETKNGHLKVNTIIQPSVRSSQKSAGAGS